MPTMSIDFIQWLHQAFYEHLPDELLWVSTASGDKRVQVVPGVFRKAGEDVEVGVHIPPRGDIKQFLERFIKAYVLEGKGALQKLIIAAASHHRLLWIHPFLDGNGRVARLFSYAVLCDKRA